MKPKPFLIAALLLVPTSFALARALSAPRPSGGAGSNAADSGGAGSYAAHFDVAGSDAAPLVAEAKSVASAPAAALAADPEFREKFEKAMEKGSRSEMDKLVKAENSAAAAWIARANEILAERPDDPETVPFLADLTVAWESVMKSEFPEREKAYFAALTGRDKEDRPDLRRRYDKAVSEFDSNAEKKDGWVYSQLVDELDVLASAFDQIGDHYMSSEAWIYYAACVDEPLRGAAADFKRALQGLERAIEERVKVDLADARKDEAEKRRAVVAERVGASSPGGAQERAEPTDAGATVTIPLTFQVLPSIDAIQRPCWSADENYVTWREIALGPKGSTTNLESTPGAPTIYRVGASDVRFDTDGDGQGDGDADAKLPLTGNITPVKIDLGRGENARPWAFFITPATQQESYQDVSLNFSASDERYRLFVLGAASVTGTLGGVPIRIIDDSMEGVYGNEPLSYGFAGLTRGLFQPDMDSIVVGEGKRARPWSEYQEVGGKWWNFEMSSQGKEIKASPIKTETGILKLEFKGPVAPAWVVVRGTGALKNAFFDLVEGGAKGVAVPVGRYTLAYGEIRKGKKRQIQKCVILPPSHGGASYDVQKDGTTVVSLGAPFGMAFDYKVEEEKVTITGKSVAVTGAQGEHYVRAWKCVPKPEASWRKKGAKSAAKSVKMNAVQDTEAIENLGFEAAWFPLDTVLLTKGADEVEVQLVDKKHDLFGKVESAWK